MYIYIYIFFFRYFFCFILYIYIFLYYWLNHKSVCRTVLATRGMYKKVNKWKVFFFFYLIYMKSWSDYYNFDSKFSKIAAARLNIAIFEVCNVLNWITWRFIGPCKSWTNARFGNTQFVRPNTHVFTHPGV